jgi:hypothetical protein
MDSTGLITAAGGLAAGSRQVTAVARFRAGPGREQQAAQAWAAELTWCFARGTGEEPAVRYDPDEGIYTVTGTIRTTYPFDEAVTCFTPAGPPPGLSWILDPARQQALRDAWSRRAAWFDGHDHDLLDGHVLEEAGHDR